MIKHVHLYGNSIYLYEGMKTSALTPAQYRVLQLASEGKRVDQIICELSNGEVLDEIDYKKLQNNLTLFLNNCNENKLMLSPDYREYGEAGKFYPKTLNIELLDKCNFFCSHCYKEASSANHKVLDPEILDYICNCFKSKIPVIHFTGGEPLLYPNIEKILDDFSEHFVVNITTNGSMLHIIPKNTIKKIHNFQVSLYGRNDETYHNVTGQNGMFEVVYNNLHALAKNEIPFTIGININQDVFTSIQDYGALINELKPDYVIFSIIGVAGRGKKTDFWRVSDEQYHDLTDYVRSHFTVPTNVSIDLPDEPCKKKDCTAGKTQLTISEAGNLVYCNVLDHTYFSIGSVYDLSKYCKKGYDDADFNRRLHQYQACHDCSGHICPLLECK